MHTIDKYISKSTPYIFSIAAIYYGCHIAKWLM